MTKKTEQELLDSYKNRIKKQNDAIKNRYDRVSATLPKGTIDRINALGLSINGVINQSVLAFLKLAEESSSNAERLEELQDFLDVASAENQERIKAAKKIEEERLEREQQAHKEEYAAMVDAWRKGETTEDPEKEQVRKENMIKYQGDF